MIAQHTSVERQPDGEALSNPFGGPATEQTTWKTLVAQLRRASGLDLRAGLVNDADSRPTAVFTFPRPQVSLQTSHRQVDVLLTQAQSLLENALHSLQEWESLASQAFAQSLDIEQYALLEQIHQKEASAQPVGYYDWLPL